MALLVVALIVVPLLELWVIIQIGGLIGALPTIALLLACSLGGAWLLRREGRAAWQRLNSAIAQGRVPARETVDGALILLGGALLLTPGFLTDICGALLLVRPVRDAVRSIGLARLVGGGWRGVAFAAASHANSRRTAGRDRAAAQTAGTQPGAGRPRRDYDFDGTAVEVDTDLRNTIPELPETRHEKP